MNNWNRVKKINDCKEEKKFDVSDFFSKEMLNTKIRISKISSQNGTHKESCINQR